MSLRLTLPGAVDLFEVHRAAPEQFPFLLQSVAGHPQAGRYDLLFGFPDERLHGAEGFRLLGQRWNDMPRCGADADGLPFLGGWFLFMAYEAAAFLEPGLRLPAAPFRLPDFLAVRCPAAIVFDRERQQTHLVAERDASQIQRMRTLVEPRLQVVDAEEIDEAPESLVLSVEEEDPRRFLRSVARIHEYLLAGDCFQVNLSRRWQGQLRPGCGYASIYRRLRRHNPAPFAGLALFDDVAVLSSSPERLVQMEGRRVQTRPIAGTRPRGQGDDDTRLRQQLIGSLKERAEHVMLIDLERNDLGRVCEPGSIEVSELMNLESYAHVHHIVSNVRGRLRTDAGPGDILAAVFPAGTITGCPKLRAMEIIAELEGEGRGPYTGSMGYLSRCGRMDSNILIRSLVVQDEQVSLRAGAGIVADSVGEAELAETRFKARGMLLALGDVAA